MDVVAPSSNNRRIRFEDDYEDHPPGEDPIVKDPSRFLGKLDDLSSDQDRSKAAFASPPKAQPTALQQKMLAMAGQDIDQFMKEVQTFLLN